jgi:hypothetical protein
MPEKREFSLYFINFQKYKSTITKMREINNDIFPFLTILFKNLWIKQFVVSILWQIKCSMAPTCR